MTPGWVLSPEPLLESTWQRELQSHNLLLDSPSCRSDLPTLVSSCQELLAGGVGETPRGTFLRRAARRDTLLGVGGGCCFNGEEVVRSGLLPCEWKSLETGLVWLQFEVQ